MSNARILVVDDEPAVERLIKQMFRRHVREEGWSFAFASNGAEAIEVLKSDLGFDMVLSDINMPVMDGITLLSNLRTMEPPVRAVIVSAYGDLTNIRGAMNRGAFDFVTKPIEAEDLETTIRKTLSEVAAERAMRGRVEAADLANKSKSLFLATMSHEIRTPMNGVLGMLELVRGTQLDAEQSELVAVAHDSAQALLAIIDDILDSARIEAGKLALDPIEVSPAEIAETLGGLLAARAAGKGIELVIRIDPGTPASMRADPVRLRQVLLNLAGNAIKFTDHGHVQIRLMPAPAQPDRLRAEIVDTGIGLSDPQKSKLFEAFSQADASTTRNYGGSGLGLSICRRLIEMMGGEIGVDSAEGTGSTFWFEIPIVAAVPAEPDTRLAGVEVLLVELYPALADALAIALEAAGAVVHRAEAGAAKRTIAAAAQSGKPFGSVIVDVARDGPEALNLADGLDGKPILVALTAQQDLESRQQSRAAGRYALTKPVSRHRLVDAVAAAARGQAPGQEAAVPAAARPAQTHAGQTILVVDDIVANRTLAIRQLARLGYESVAVASGREGLANLASRDFALILIDGEMPEMDGFTFTRDLRAAEAASGRPRKPVIGMTALTQASDVQRFHDAGADGVLHKPVMIDKLREVLESHLASKPTAEIPADPPIDIGKLAGLLGEPEGTGAAALSGLILGFVSEAETLLENLTTALAARDRQAVRRAAHAAKGAAAAFAADRLAGALGAIESGAGDLEWPVIEQHAGAAAHEYGRVRAVYNPEGDSA